MSKRLLGIDYGAKKVGLALSDEEGRMAFPLSVLPNDKKLLDVIGRMVWEKEVAKIIIGESKDRDGKPNPIMKKTTRFAGELEKKCKVPVCLEPEFYTSRQAQVIQGKTEKEDASAAAIILQSYMDKLS